MSGLRDEAADIRGEAQSGMPVADDWASQYEGVEGAEEQPAKVSGQTLPTFPFYIVRFENGKGAFTKGKKQTPMARVRAAVANGPEGTINERVFDDLFLRVSKTYQDNGVEVEKDAADYENDKTNFQQKLKKIGRVGKFGMLAPKGSDLASIDAYASQFSNGFAGIVEIREQSNEWQGNTRIQNRIIWESIRAFDDPPTKNGQKKGYKTALEEAEAMIAQANQAAAAKAGKDGRTAGSVSRRGLSD